MNCMLPLSLTLSYYKRKDIQEEIIKAAENREVAVRYNDNFGSRPDVLNNPKDVLELAKQKATSFHSSEELWQNPLQLSTHMKKHELDALRIGWDLVLDIDCKFFDYSKIAADLVIRALKFNDVGSISCKFSGNKGFHIGVPFEAFPDIIKTERTRNMFPDAARKIAFYIKEMIKKPLGEGILNLEGDFSKVIKKTKENPDKITYYEDNRFGDKVAKLNAEPFLNIDTILISSRHLYRAPYSLHEGSGLVSLPLNPEDVLNFKKEHACPKNIRISQFRFLDRGGVVKGEARNLIMQAFDFTLNRAKDIAMPKRKYEVASSLPQDFFPPCIQLILKNQLKDGRKRAVFILLNFLTSVGWDYDEIENLLREWNKKNEEPLRDGYLVGQIIHHRQLRKKILPPNCNNRMYMVDIGVCKPDNLCNKIKNPVSYSVRKSLFLKKTVKNEN